MNWEPLRRRKTSEVNEFVVFHRDMSLDLSFLVTIKRFEVNSEPSRTSKMKLLDGWFGWMERYEDKCNLLVSDQRFGTISASLVIQEFEKSAD